MSQRRTHDHADDVEHFHELGTPAWMDGGDHLLFHYTSAETALRHILPEGKLRMNPYEAMRDPLENKEIPFAIRLRTESSASIDLLDAQAAVRDMRNQMRLLSLTSDATGYDSPQLRAFGRGYARPRMWEQYGGKHTGICLAFDAGLMTRDFWEELQRHGSPACGPVEYTPGGFATSEARWLDGDGLTESNMLPALTAHIVRHHHAFWFLKLCDWETEFEYRFVLFSPDANHKDPIDLPFGKALRGLVLGERFDSTVLPAARRLAQRYDVPLTRLHWRTGRPSLKEIVKARVVV